MANKLRKLKKRQLLELLVAQGKELETVQQDLEKARERIAELEDQLKTLVEAGLESAKIVEHARQEAETYEKTRMAEAEEQAEAILAKARGGAPGEDGSGADPDGADGDGHQEERDDEQEEQETTGTADR